MLVYFRNKNQLEDEGYVEVMEPEKIVDALGNDSRVRILQLVLAEPMTATETHETYLDTFDGEKHRETVYRYLETLVDAGLVKKEYHSSRGLVYSAPHSQLILDLENWTATPIDDVPPASEESSE